MKTILLIAFIIAISLHAIQADDVPNPFECKSQECWRTWFKNYGHKLKDCLDDDQCKKEHLGQFLKACQLNKDCAEGLKAIQEDDKNDDGEKNPFKRCKGNVQCWAHVFSSDPNIIKCAKSSKCRSENKDKFSMCSKDSACTSALKHALENANNNENDKRVSNPFKDCKEDESCWDKFFDRDPHYTKCYIDHNCRKKEMENVRLCKQHGVCWESFFDNRFMKDYMKHQNGPPLDLCQKEKACWDSYMDVQIKNIRKCAKSRRCRTEHADKFQACKANGVCWKAYMEASSGENNPFIKCKGNVKCWSHVFRSHPKVIECARSSSCRSKHQEKFTMCRKDRACAAALRRALRRSVTKGRGPNPFRRCGRNKGCWDRFFAHNKGLPRCYINGQCQAKPRNKKFFKHCERNMACWSVFNKYLSPTTLCRRHTGCYATVFDNNPAITRCLFSETCFNQHKTAYKHCHNNDVCWKSLWGNSHIVAFFKGLPNDAVPFNLCRKSKACWRSFFTVRPEHKTDPKYSHIVERVFKK